MPKLVECIPNFSEGRRQDVIDALALAARGVPGAALLDYSADKSHNRSVFTLLGSPLAIAEAAFALAKVAAERIDLTQHAGEHPRIGATDVIPLVPLSDMSMAECAELSRQIAARIAGELAVPCFLYEASATSEKRRNLADIRRGGFEGMPKKLLKEGWAPDYGEKKIHPTAGVTAVGARRPLIAFNVNLSTGDVSIAKKIAKVIRQSSGGLSGIKALGVMLHERNTAQVTMNITDYEKAPLYRAVEMIRMEAKRYGVSVVSSELIGLSPMKAFADSAAYYLQLENYDFGRQVLENHLL